MEKLHDENYYIDTKNNIIHRGNCEIIQSINADDIKWIAEARTKEDALKLGKLFIHDSKECKTCLK